MSSIESLVRRLSGAHYRCISSISHELPVLSVGRDCCILNSIGSFHSLLTVVRAFSISRTFILAVCKCFFSMDVSSNENYKDLIYKGFGIKTPITSVVSSFVNPIRVVFYSSSVILLTSSSTWMVTSSTTGITSFHFASIPVLP